MVTVTAPSLPCYRSIVAVDIESSTARTNPTKAQLRQELYKLFEESLQVGGITDSHHDALIDRGDGILALVHPVDQAPKALLLNSFIPTLSRLLTDHNTRDSDRQFRLRAVVHAGEVHYDNRGCFGEALDITFRLLDAAKVKRRLLQTAAPLVLVVSDDIYRSIIRHGYPGIDESAFERLVRVRLAGQWHRGWIHIPAKAPLASDDGLRHRLDLGRGLVNRFRASASLVPAHYQTDVNPREGAQVKPVVHSPLDIAF